MTTLITEEPEPVIAGAEDVLLCIGRFKELTPPQIGARLICKRGSSILWSASARSLTSHSDLTALASDLVAQTAIDDVNLLKAVLDAGVFVSNEYAESKRNPLLVHLVNNRYMKMEFNAWLEVLLNAGADPTRADSKTGYNALLTAINRSDSASRCIDFFNACLDKWGHMASFDQLFRSREGATIFHLLADGRTSQVCSVAPELQRFDRENSF